jgi:hypothetical protein
VIDTALPPSRLRLNVATPDSTATSGVPPGASMSTPSWLRPPDRGAPQVSANDLGPATGHTIPTPASGAGGGGGVGAAGAGVAPGEAPDESSGVVVPPPSLSFDEPADDELPEDELPEDTFGSAAAAAAATR